MKKSNRVMPVKIEKSSFIVLLISVVLFASALCWIHQDSILSRTKDAYTAYDVGTLEFEKATVTKILNEDMEIDEAADGTYKGMQELSVVVKSGRYKGETMTAYNYFGVLNGVPISVGDSITIAIAYKSEELSATVYEFNRIPVLAVFLLLFFVVVVIVGGRTGLKSMIGLAFTILCLFTFLIPLLLKGAPTVFTTFIMCAYIALVSFTILGGIHRKTISAFLGTVSGAFFAMVFGLAVQHLSKIDGLRLQDTEALLQLNYAGFSIGLKGLLTAGIIISALGAVMDVAMSISSALEEIHAADPSMPKHELFRSGMNIGRDMVGTMTNTLILAFLGSELTLIIYFCSRGLSFYHMYSTAYVALETISGISSSIGMVLAIPLTALISSSLIAGKRIR